MSETKRQCSCGAVDCWDMDDFSWLSSNSGWHGTLHGCETSVFFIHGRKIREQRHIPAGSWHIPTIDQQFAAWSQGLPNARLIWCHDTGGGNAGLWIEGEREPIADDLTRLAECRERQEKQDRREFKRLSKRFGIAPMPQGSGGAGRG